MLVIQKHLFLNAIPNILERYSEKHDCYIIRKCSGADSFIHGTYSKWLHFTVNNKWGGLPLAKGSKYRKVSPDYIIRNGIGNLT